jgi:hypothetical protein
MRNGWCVAALCAACGAGGQVTGTVAGTSIAAVRGAYASEEAGGAGGEFALWIVLSDAEKICAAHRANGVVQGSKTLFLKLQKNDAEGQAAPTIGAYTVGPESALTETGERAIAYLGSFGGESCSDTIGEAGVATAGTVKLDKLDLAGNATAGTFDVSFGNEKLTGSFNAATCAGNPQFSGCYTP